MVRPLHIGNSIKPSKPSNTVLWACLYQFLAIFIDSIMYGSNFAEGTKIFLPIIFKTILQCGKGGKFENLRF